MGDCVFCSIARGVLSTPFVAADDTAVAIDDLNPAAPTHVLVIPREHFASVQDLPDPGVAGHLVAMAIQVAAERGLAGTGYRLVFNTGADGGQTVSHVHLHLLGGRQMGWPPG
jgi:histidine triad (HIT) family protein